MASAPNLIIDIGHRSIKVLQVSSGKKGKAQIQKAGVESLPLPPNADQETINQCIQETLPILLQRVGIKAKRAIVALPGRAAFTRRLQIPIVRGRQLARIIRYEAKQHVPFPLEQVNMDYQVSPPVEGGVELDVHLVAVRREVADAYSGILKKCGIRSDIIEAAPLSIYNAYAASPLKDNEEVTAIVSIGASSTDIVIEQNGAMQFMRSAPIAGNYLSSLLAKKFEIPFEEAETLKKKAASDYNESSGRTPEEVASVLEQGFETIITEIKRSFDFYVSQPEAAPVTRVMLCGGAVRMEGVSEFLEDRLGCPVSIFDAGQLAEIEIPADHKENLRLEAPLMGMAMRAINKASCALSFSPPKIKQRIELERRAPMLSLMGFLIVLMMTGSFYLLDGMVERKSVAAQRINEIIRPGALAQPELREAREVQDRYEQRYERINLVAERRGILSRTYLEVQNLIPDNIWLDSIDVRSDRMTVKGRALNVVQLTQYARNLTLSAFFDNEAVVISESATVTDLGGSFDQPQIRFTIDILRYNAPAEEEIRFIERLRSLVTDTTILMVRILGEGEIEHAVAPAADTGMGAGFGGYGGMGGYGAMGGYGGAPAPAPDTGAYATQRELENLTIIVGVYENELADFNQRVAFLNRVNTALRDTLDDAATRIELRFHDGLSNEVERMLVQVDQLARYAEGSLGQEDFMETVQYPEPQPSPTPSPTPEPDMEDGDMMMGAGMYGMGMYGMGMGMYGMGMGMGY